MLKKFENLEKLTNGSSGGRRSLSFSIVNTECNGKRLKLSQALLKELNMPARVDIFVNETKTGVYIIPADNGQTLSKGGAIYDAILVERISNGLKLDFNGRSSYTFNNICFTEEEGEKYAEVIINEMQRSTSENSAETGVSESCE